jgi:N-acetyl-anhydromuramyl-L-alanine amidase AmpD
MPPSNTASRRAFLQATAALGAAIALAAVVYRATRRTYTMEAQGIISRAAWGAAEPNLNAANEHGMFDRQTNPDGWQIYTQPLDQVLTTVVIHHSALPLRDGPREIQHVHMTFSGFADIAYHFVIDDGGRLFEGRPLNARGAHTRGHNTGTVGVVLLGNFEHGDPTPEQLATLTTLLLSLRDTYGITHLAGHRDFLPTETVCPGQALEARLPELARTVDLHLGTDGYRAPP